VLELDKVKGLCLLRGLPLEVDVRDSTGTMGMTLVSGFDWPTPWSPELLQVDGVVELVTHVKPVEVLIIPGIVTDKRLSPDIPMPTLGLIVGIPSVICMGDDDLNPELTEPELETDFSLFSSSKGMGAIL